MTKQNSVYILTVIIVGLMAFTSLAAESSVPDVGEGLHLGGLPPTQEVKKGDGQVVLNDFYETWAIAEFKPAALYLKNPAGKRLNILVAHDYQGVPARYFRMEPHHGELVVGTDGPWKRFEPVPKDVIWVPPKTDPRQGWPEDTVFKIRAILLSQPKKKT